MFRPRLSCIMLAVVSAACGYSAPTGPGDSPPDPLPNDVAIVRGASTLTTTAFDPSPRALDLGDRAEVSVRWVNADGGQGYGGGTAVPHQIASDDGAFATSAPLGSGATYTVAFDNPGTYRYHCAIHPSMVGTIIVRP